MKQGEILNAYRVLGESKMTTLEVGEVVKVVKARKAMRPIAEGVDAFMRDIQEKAAHWESMSEEQRAELNKAVGDELAKEVEVNIEKMDIETLAKIAKENGFKTKDMDMLDLMV